MADIFSVGVECNTVLQIAGLLIVACFYIEMGRIAYAIVSRICDLVLHYRKANINIDKNDAHTGIKLSQ